MALLANFISVPIEVSNTSGPGLFQPNEFLNTRKPTTKCLLFAKDAAKAHGAAAQDHFGLTQTLHPLQLALIVPYMRIGEWLTGAPHVNFSPVGLKARAPSSLRHLVYVFSEGCR